MFCHHAPIDLVEVFVNNFCLIVWLTSKTVICFINWARYYIYFHITQLLKPLLVLIYSYPLAFTILYAVVKMLPIRCLTTVYIFFIDAHVYKTQVYFWDRL